MNSPRQGIKDIPEICARLGMTHAVISPGSRNAPLIMSFTAHKRIVSLSITDERSAGYFALGMAQWSGNPVGIVCTSGTASLNLMPAVAEAFYQSLPLIIFTADRPSEWIDQADGQTVRQREVFRNHVKQSFELPVETSNETDLWYNNRVVSQAINLARQHPAGPVHINVPLREPLYTPLPLQNENLNVIKIINSASQLSDRDFALLVKKWKSFKSKMVVSGFMNPDTELNSTLGMIAERKDTVVITGNLSNLHHPGFIYSPERLFAALSEGEKNDFRPELLITIGKSVVSKKLKQYLRIFKPIEHWNIDLSNEFTDTYQSLTININTSPRLFFSKLTETEENSGNQQRYAEFFRNKEEIILQKHNEFICKSEFSDLKVFNSILEKIPANTNLHLTNSTPVRYSQLFPSRSDLNYYCNRGTSGIDGCISTAAGSAYISKKPVTIISGDLAFIYDSNGMWNNYLGKDFRIIVLNNGGGNIFRLIDTSSEINKIMDYFETPHQVNLEFLSKSFGLNHYFCNDLNSLNNQLNLFFSEAGPSVLEIKTDAATDAKEYKKYFRNLIEE